MKVIVSSYIWWQNKFFPTVSTSSPADTLNQKLLLHLHEKCLSHNLKTMPQEVLRRNSLTWAAVTTIRRWLWHLGLDLSSGRVERMWHAQNHVKYLGQPSRAFSSLYRSQTLTAEGLRVFPWRQRVPTRWRWQTDRVTLCGRQQDKDVTQA